MCNCNSNDESHKIEAEDGEGDDNCQEINRTRREVLAPGSSTVLKLRTIFMKSDLKLWNYAILSILKLCNPAVIL